MPEMISIARDSADKEHVLWSGCFAGAPLRKLKWTVRANFGEYPPGLDPDTPLADDFNQARAIGLRKKLRAMIVNTRQTARGSGQLEALEVAAEVPDLVRVYLLTDAAVHEHGVPKLYRATPAEIRRTAYRWAPRLRGLHDVELLLIGAGYGAHNSPGVRAARTLFQDLADRIGTASFEWAQELPPGYPPS